MSKWFPDVDDHEGVDAALKGGFYGALGFAASLLIGIAFLLITGSLPVSGTQVGGSVAALIGILVELAVVLVAAWRFKIGKGLVWGAFVLFLFTARAGTSRHLRMRVLRGLGLAAVILSLGYTLAMFWTGKIEGWQLIVLVVVAVIGLPTAMNYPGNWLTKLVKESLVRRSSAELRSVGRHDLAEVVEFEWNEDTLVWKPVEE